MLQRCSIVLFVFLFTSTLAGQALVGRSAGVDLGALATDEVRLGVEPMVSGRWSLHIALARWANTLVRPAGGFAQAAGLEENPGNTELGVDFTLRFYPPSLSSAVPEHRFRVYVGVGGGVHQRTSAGGGALACRDRCVVPIGSNLERRRGVEPAAEIGVRFEPAGSLLLDIGLRTRVIAFSDPTGRFTTGHVDPHLAVALGFGW